ncbi:MAG: hypothetical protein WBW49_07795, partial [Candidatus Acidiferrum sp.]
GAPLEDTQARHLYGQLGFALLGEKALKLGGECGEDFHEGEWFFSLLSHGYQWRRLLNRNA